jgi:hypothetical protein
MNTTYVMSFSNILVDWNFKCLNLSKKDRSKTATQLRDLSVYQLPGQEPPCTIEMVLAHLYGSQ